VADTATGEGTEALLERARQQAPWYHTIELVPGFTSAGHVDLRGVAPRILPARLDGLRALDIGTYDGFWAFELEARGAAAVVATDLEHWDFAAWPPHTRAKHAAEFADLSLSERFHIAHSLLGSRVSHVGCSIYDLSAERLGGAVDFAVIGALLLHLRDPIAGLEAARGVIRPGGRLLLVEPFDLRGTFLRPLTPTAKLRAHCTPWDWWLGNLAYLRRILLIAGFRSVRPVWLFRLNAVADMRVPFVALRASVPL
jgi:SAM-dependent methyltransferase